MSEPFGPLTDPVFIEYVRQNYPPAFVKEFETLVEDSKGQPIPGHPNNRTLDQLDRLRLENARLECQAAMLKSSVIQMRSKCFKIDSEADGIAYRAQHQSSSTALRDLLEPTIKLLESYNGNDCPWCGYFTGVEPPIVLGSIHRGLHYQNCPLTADLTRLRSITSPTDK